MSNYSPYFPKAPDEEWEKARIERAKWEADQKELKEKQQKEEEEKAEWRKEFDRDMEIIREETKEHRQVFPWKRA